MSLLTRFQTVDENSPGIKLSPVIEGLPIVDRDASDDSDEPRPEIQSVRPGGTIYLDGEPAHVICVGERSNYGQQGLFQIGLRHDAFGTPCTMYVDRDPYIVDQCNGPIYTVDPDQVSLSKEGVRGDHD